MELRMKWGLLVYLVYLRIFTNHIEALIPSAHKIPYPRLVEVLWPLIK